MDALKMLKTAKRYCKHVESCCVCEIGGETCLFDSAPEHMSVALMVDTVSFLERWEREHPGKTKGELFIERNPDCKRSAICPGIPEVKPCDYDESFDYKACCSCYSDCYLCRKAYWEEPVE
mgnify:CR=1 FL=1|jgi:hypothetical protein